jgi:hypothetical protein
VRAAPEFRLDDAPVLLVGLAQQVSANGRHYQIGKLKAGHVVVLGAQIKPDDPIIDVARSNVPRAPNLEIQPSQFELSGEVRVAFLGNDYSPARMSPISKQKRSTNTSRLSI